MVIKQRKPEGHVSSWLILIYIFLALIVIIILFLNTVKVPYEITETVTIKEPKTISVTVNYTEPYEVKEVETEKIPVKYTDCGYKDTNFSVEYIGDLSKMAYDYRTNTGYIFNPGDVGGGGFLGRYMQKARICNRDIYDYNQGQHGGLKIVFDVCFFYDNKLVDCPNKLSIQVEHYPCKDTSEGDMMWVAPFDPKRDIKLKPVSVTQKWICEEKTRVIDGKQKQTIKILQREKQRTETKQILVDKQIQKNSTIQVTLWEKLRRDYGF